MLLCSLGSRFARPATFCPVAPRSCSLRCRRCRPRARRALTIHISLGAEQPGEQARHAEIYVESLPVQAKTEAENLDLRQLCVARPLQSLRATCRKSEAAPIGEIDMDTPSPAVIPDRAGTRSVRSERAPRRSASAIMTARSSLMNSPPHRNPTLPAVAFVCRLNPIANIPVFDHTCRQPGSNKIVQRGRL